VRYPLDTNVVSELIKKVPNQRVVQWIDGCDEGTLLLRTN